MVFDPDKDKTLDERVFDADKDDQRIEVKLVTYDGGPTKVQLSRFSLSTEGERKYLKLGRVSLEEATKVRDALSELLPSAGV